MLSRASTTLFLVIFGGVSSLHAQDQTSGTNAPSPIATDRPAVADSSVVVPFGSMQVENGFLDTRSQGQNVFDAPESLVRVGVAKRTEFRFTVPDYFENFTVGSSASGFSDLALGLKQQLGPVHGFDLSVVAYLSFPSGSAGVTSGGYDPAVQVPWSRAISANWTAAGMFSVYWPTQGLTRNVTGEGTLLFDRQLTKAWDAFLEYARDFPEYGGSRHLLHFGTAYKLTAQQQIDFQAGVGLSAATVDHFIGVGYSFRFQAFHR